MKKETQMSQSAGINYVSSYFNSSPISNLSVAPLVFQWSPMSTWGSTFSILGKLQSSGINIKLSNFFNSLHLSICIRTGHFCTSPIRPSFFFSICIILADWEYPTALLLATHHPKKHYMILTIPYLPHLLSPFEIFLLLYPSLPHLLRYKKIICFLSFPVLMKGTKTKIWNVL